MLSYDGKTFQEIDLPHDVYHMIREGSVLKYDKGTYSVVEGESIFDLQPSLPFDSEYCKRENVYFTPKGKLNKAQLELLNNMNNPKNEENIFTKIYNMFQKIKEKIVGIFHK